MPFATSSDGTRIGYSVVGSGPAIVLVDGALCWRASGPAGPLADQLKDRFAVYTYDRRGRGESGDTKPYSNQRRHIDPINDARTLATHARRIEKSVALFHQGKNQGPGSRRTPRRTGVCSAGITS